MGIWSRIKGYVKEKLGITALERRAAEAERRAAEAERRAAEAEKKVKRYKTTIKVQKEWRAWRKTHDEEEKERKKAEIGRIIQEAEEEGIELVSP